MSFIKNSQIRIVTTLMWVRILVKHSSIRQKFFKRVLHTSLIRSILKFYATILLIVEGNMTAGDLTCETLH